MKSLKIAIFEIINGVLRTVFTGTIHLKEITVTFVLKFIKNNENSEQ